MQHEIWLTVREAALLTGVSIQTVYSWERRGHLKVEGLDERGRKLYRHLAVAQAEKTTRAGGTTRQPCYDGEKVRQLTHGLT